MSNNPQITGPPAEKVAHSEPANASEPTTPAEPRKRGAQPGNTNAMTHGWRSERQDGIVVAKLGKRFQAAYHNVRLFRRAMESELERAGRRMTLRERTKVQSIARLEMSIRALETLLRDEQGLPAEDVRRHRESITRFGLIRDKMIERLLPSTPGEGMTQLDRVMAEPWPVEGGEFHGEWPSENT